MPALKYDGGTVDLDENGYLVNVNAWNEAVAGAIAAKLGVKKLTDDHMDVVKFLRDYYMKYNTFPLIQMVCTNLHKAKTCMTKPFKMDPLMAWKIAGLPQPVEEAIVYLQGPPHPEK